MNWEDICCNYDNASASKSLIVQQFSGTTPQYSSDLCACDLCLLSPVLKQLSDWLSGERSGISSIRSGFDSQRRHLKWFAATPVSVGSETTQIPLTGILASRYDLCFHRREINAIDTFNWCFLCVATIPESLLAVLCVSQSECCSALFAMLPEKTSV